MSFGALAAQNLMNNISLSPMYMLEELQDLFDIILINMYIILWLVVSSAMLNREKTQKFGSASKQLVMSPCMEEAVHTRERNAIYVTIIKHYQSW